MSNSFRSSATLRSQVERGRPGGLLQFSAGCSRFQDQNKIPDNNFIIAKITLQLQALQLKCNLGVIFYNKF